MQYVKGNKSQPNWAENQPETFATVSPRCVPPTALSLRLDTSSQRLVLFRPPWRKKIRNQKHGTKLDKPAPDEQQGFAL